MRQLLLIGSLCAAGCENCPDRAVALSISGDAVRSTASTVTVTFPEPVFVEPSPAREADISIELVGPMQSATQLRAVWRGDADPTELERPFERVGVIDEARLELELVFAASDQAGTYELSIIGDQAGACLGPNGTVAMELL